MTSGISRRGILKGMATTALAPALLPIATAAQSEGKPWWLGDGMPQESAGTPKIACGISLGKASLTRLFAEWFRSASITC